MRTKQKRGQPFSVSLNQQSYSYRPQAAIHLSPFANYGYTHLDDPNSTVKTFLLLLLM